jgi:hypothetical protein
LRKDELLPKRERKKMKGRQSLKYVKVNNGRYIKRIAAAIRK